MQTQTLNPTTDLLLAANALRAGKLVAFPTETVFGLGADATNPSAIAAIYAAKGRPSTNPLIVHVADLATAHHFATFNPLSQKLAEKFWPGPLTLILPRRTDIPTPIASSLSAGLPTIAIRVPHHPIAEALLGTFNGPIAAPSANRSGFVSPTTPAHVLAELAGRIPYLLDGPPCTIGLESTVVDATTSTIKILRPGAITAEMLAAYALVDVTPTTIAPHSPALSPGTLDRHYAPRTPAFRLNVRQLAKAIPTLDTPTVLLTYEHHLHLPAPHHTTLLPPKAPAYANVLYAALRQADDLQAAQILILCPATTEGLWLAITDRLRRATQPWPEK